MTNGNTEVKLEFAPAFVPESQIIIPLKRVPEKPAPAPWAPAVVEEEIPLILNIETTGLYPWQHRIISIGYQDPSLPEETPTIIMMEDEAAMISALLTVIKDIGYNQLIVYGGSFDFRFIVLRAMKHNIALKEFADMEIYDLGQSMAQVKHAFVYFPQKQPKLSDIADFFWNYPKPFSDTEMIKYYKLGQLDKVREFASSQITRILLLYYLFRQITESPYVPAVSGVESPSSSNQTPPMSESVSKLTIPEANAPETEKWKCKLCLSEFDLPKGQANPLCGVCNTALIKN